MRLTPTFLTGNRWERLCECVSLVIAPNRALCGSTQEPIVRRHGSIACTGVIALVAPLAVVAAAAAEGPVPDMDGAVVYSEGQSAERVADELGTWRIRRTRNPHGSFVLIRNESSVALSVTHGGIPAESLIPGRAIATDCSGEAASQTLVLGIYEGDVFYSDSVECGDAVQITLVDLTAESPAGSSAEHTLFDLTAETDRWRVSHTKNDKGRLIVIRNAGGPVFVSRDGTPASTVACGADHGLVLRRTWPGRCHDRGEERQEDPAVSLLHRLWRRSDAYKGG